MNKAQLVEQLSRRIRATKCDSETFLDATLEIIQRAVSKGDEVKLVGFGTFSAAHRKERTARNPKTGESVVVPKSKVPRFKAGKDFRDRMK
ncbi:MAG TPA: HU family DNA-binding protein [Pseudobdellovibrionaceae bacterium]|nr:HU family DNA-binding protein [Pseudobdellovibrionaceae bacterium]